MLSFALADQEWVMNIMYNTGTSTNPSFYMYLVEWQEYSDQNIGLTTEFAQTVDPTHVTQLDVI